MGNGVTDKCKICSKVLPNIHHATPTTTSTFNIDLSNSFDISYRILPKPHYLIKDTKTALAEIKELNVYISQNNLFN